MEALKVLFLDDDQERHNSFYKELKRQSIDSRDAEIYPVFGIMDAQDELQANAAFFDIAFLDHDLGGQHMVARREGTGTIVAEYIAAMPKDQQPKLVVVHSFNAMGAQRMMKILQDAKVRCLYIPFDTPGFYEVFKLSRESGQEV